MVCGPGAGLLAKVFEVCDGMALSSLEFRKLAGGLMRQLPEVRCAPANQPRDKGTVSLNVLFSLRVGRPNRLRTPGAAGGRRRVAGTVERDNCVLQQHERLFLPRRPLSGCWWQRVQSIECAARSLFPHWWGLGWEPRCSTESNPAWRSNCHNDVCHKWAHFAQRLHPTLSHLGGLPR